MADAQDVFLSVEQQLDPRHTALIVVDVQNDFAHEKGFLGTIGLDVELAQSTIGRINDSITLARSHDIPVMYLQVIFAERTSQPNVVAHFASRAPVVAEGTWGAELHADLLPPAPGEPVVVKGGYDGFSDTDLDLMLRAKGIKTILLVGVSTNVCVETTARHGFSLGYYVVVAGDCCFAATPEAHEAALHNLRLHFGAVVSSDDIARMWGGATS